MPRTGTPASSRPAGAGGAPSAYTEAGPPDRMTAAGLRARICSAGIVHGTISEFTWHSRTRRAISCAYCAPKSTTSTVSESPACTTSPSRGFTPALTQWRATTCSLGGALAWGGLAAPLARRRARGPLSRWRGSRVLSRRRGSRLLVQGRAGCLVARGRTRSLLVRRGAAPAHLAYPDPGDAPAVQFGHGEPVPVDLDLSADLRQFPQHGEHVTGHGLIGALGQAHARLLGELIQVQQPVHLDLAAAQPRRALFDVVLVLDLADQLLDQILQGHDAGGSPELVHHDRHVGPVPPHLRKGGE